MRILAEVWPDPAKVPQLVALLPWGHLRVLLDQLKDPALRECTCGRQSNTVGAALCWFSRSRAACMSGLQTCGRLGAGPETGSSPCTDTF